MISAERQKELRDVRTMLEKLRGQELPRYAADLLLTLIANELSQQGLSQEDRDDAARYRFCKQHGWPRRVSRSETLWYMDRAADNVEMVRSSFEECLDAAMGEPNV